MPALREINWSEWYDGMDAEVEHLERAYSPSRFLNVLQKYLHCNARVLELGCAPGRWLAWSSARLAVRPTGLELDSRGILLTKTLYPQLPIVRADAFSLPFVANSFDGVYSIGLIEHFQSPRRIIEEARRVLEPGGVSIWLVPNLAEGSICRWHWRTFRRENYEAHRCFTLDELSEAVTAGGMQVTHREHSGLYLPHFQRIMGRLPFRGVLKYFENRVTASNLIVVAIRPR